MGDLSLNALSLGLTRAGLVLRDFRAGRNQTTSRNALCGANVQKVDRNIASQTIHTKGCIIAILEWASDHGFLVAFLLLLETLLLTVMIFQSTHLVNELQMMNGVYRGPWWTWVGKQRPGRPPRLYQGVGGHHQQRPAQTLPFHLELVWHEPSTSDGQWRPQIGQLQAGPNSAQQTFEGVPQTGEPNYSGHQASGEVHYDVEPIDPRATARYEQRRSTIGQRFFRAVISRASRLVHRRRAVTAQGGAGEEEREQSAAAPRQQGRGDWVVHHRAREVGSVGPATAAARALQPLGEERETEPSAVTRLQKSPLPPIGGRVNEQSAKPEVEVEVEPVEQLVEVQDSLSTASIDKEELFEKRKTSQIIQPSPVTVKKQLKDPKNFEKRKSLLPGLIVSQNQIKLPTVHSTTSQKPSTEVEVENALEAKANESEATASSNVTSVPDAVTRSEGTAGGPPSTPISDVPRDTPAKSTPPDSTFRAAEAPPTQKPPTEPSSTKAAATPSLPTAPTIAKVSPSVGSQPLAMKALKPPSVDVSSGPVAKSAVETSKSDDDEVQHREASAASPQHSEADEDAVSHEETDDDTGRAVSISDKGSPAGPEDAFTPDGEQDQDVYEERSKDTSERKSKRGHHHHHKKLKSHKKKKHKKKKGEVSPAPDGDKASPAGPSGLAADPVPEWLKPSPQNSADDHAADTGTGSVHFTPSEFKKLAVVQKTDPEAGKALAHARERKGTIATAISKKLHDIMPNFNPGSASHSPHTQKVEGEEHISLARAVSRKLHDILPTFDFHHGGSKPKPEASNRPARMLSPDPEVEPTGVFRRPSTARGRGTEGESRTPSPLRSMNANSDAEW
ncbi:hypothetical protein FJT64_011597 [Amphibalanus amphitrite]|uniref:Uncharacterized protein n=2 Tax=Amphibalanus amphitrite TaxID=1232801 RepID=A0A6A4VIA0_AMPAM|nr:hypothetical protein FJT64_011597 [Amphibalanus amphitrite]